MLALMATIFIDTMAFIYFGLKRSFHKVLVFQHLICGAGLYLRVFKNALQVAISPVFGGIRRCAVRVSVSCRHEHAPTHAPGLRTDVGFVQERRLGAIGRGLAAPPSRGTTSTLHRIGAGLGPPAARPGRSQWASLASTVVFLTHRLPLEVVVLAALTTLAGTIGRLGLRSCREKTCKPLLCMTSTVTHGTVLDGVGFDLAWHDASSQLRRPAWEQST